METTTLDKFGRVLIPKRLRDDLKAQRLFALNADDFRRVWPEGAAPIAAP